MRQTISGLIAAIAVVTASAAPAMACGRGGGLHEGCAAYERLPDPEQQYRHAYRGPKYYYVNQGPTFTGPGDFAPYPIYQEGAVSAWDVYRRRPWRHHHQIVLRRYY
jgi:hypothetical protein